MMVNQCPVVRLRMGDRWWDLRLKGGPRYRRQLAAYAQVLSGDAIAGELALYRRRAHEGPITARPNGNQRAPYAVVCKMVAWLPRVRQDGRQHSAGVLRVRTAKDALLVAVLNKDVPVWQYHGNHLRRWSAAHRQALQHFAEDHKAEQRLVPSFADRRTAVATKYRHRMRSAVQETAAQLVGYAARRKCAAIEYDDSVTAFCPDFPYGALRERIRTQCDAAGVAFELASGMEPSVTRPVTLSTEEPLAEVG